MPNRPLTCGGTSHPTVTFWSRTKEPSSTQRDVIPSNGPTPMAVIVFVWLVGVQ